MKREEAIKILADLTDNLFLHTWEEQYKALHMAIEALSAKEAVWNEYEAEFTDLPDIPRYYYEKVVGKMAHEINMLKEQLESADAEWIFNPKDAIELMFTKPKCSECGFESSDGGNFCPNCGAKMKGGAE